jgi:hypothetical protein
MADLESPGLGITVREMLLRHTPRIDGDPFNEVFLQNRYYLREHRGSEAHDSTPVGAPPRFADEVAWWVWLCHGEGLRKIEPSLLRWASQAMSAAAAEHRQHGHQVHSITDLTAAAVVRQAVLLFQRRNNRLPSPGARRNIPHLIEHLHLYLSVRCTDTAWWAHDVWDLRADPRIPQREHEPDHDKSVKIGAIGPQWLREGCGSGCGRHWMPRCCGGLRRSTEPATWHATSESLPAIADTPSRG